MTQVEVFPVSDVIYVGIGRGREEMERMHAGLNVDGLKFPEPYPYHPHITLAQDLKGDEVDELARVARTRWAESTVPKTFRVDEVFFVQNTRRKEWLDLGESALGHPESRLVGNSRPARRVEPRLRVRVSARPITDYPTFWTALQLRKPLRECFWSLT